MAVRSQSSPLKDSSNAPPNAISGPRIQIDTLGVVFSKPCIRRGLVDKDLQMFGVAGLLARVDVIQTVIGPLLNFRSGHLND
jgi:hypothetical protein